MLKSQFLEQIRRASTILPSDVKSALSLSAENEKTDSMARKVLLSLLENADAAEKTGMPICQDTGTIIFHIDHDRSFSQVELEKDIRDAVAEATSKSLLRPNAVEPISGKNSGNNLGIGSPLIIFHESAETGLRSNLLLKGGGSENTGIQFSLPDREISAGRDIEGIRRCILEAAFRAQGFGCAPGTLGVGIGGDRMTSWMTAKEQFFRRLDDVNPDPVLARLEKKIKDEINSLGIGPMGFGGNTTVLGVKIGTRHRVPASFFVSIAYMCWAFRRCTMTLAGKDTRSVS